MLILHEKVLNQPDNIFSIILNSGKWRQFLNGYICNISYLHKEIRIIQKAIEKKLNLESRFIQCNLYDNGDIYSEYHKDIINNGDNCIAILSLGEERSIWFKNKDEEISIFLPHNSLIMFDKEHLLDYEHCIKTDNTLNKRISIVFSIKKETK